MMDLKNDIISIVITTYKRRPDEIKRTVYSVLNQTYFNLEIIIVDDSPKEYEYREQVKDFCLSINDSRIIYIQHEKNMGACVARNTGLNHARGKYISFLDDDDEYLPERIEKMKMVIESNPDISLVYSDANIIKSDGYKEKIAGSFFKGNKQYRGYVYDELMCGNFIGSTSLGMMRVSSLKKIGGFDPNLVASQDWDVWIRISKIGRVEFINDKLVNYFIHPGIRISNNIGRRIQGLKQLNEKNKEYLNRHKEAFICRKKFELRLNVLNSDLKGAFKCYKLLCNEQPFNIIDNIITLKTFGRFFLKKKE